jgi:hypothetical protein
MVNDIKTDNNIPEFSVFGGPLSKLGTRLGLVRKGTNSIRLGLVLGLLIWIILIILSLLQGSIHKIFSLQFLAGHVRFLLVIPLFFVCETWIAPGMAEFISNITNSGLVPESERPGLDALMSRIGRMKNYWLAEALLIMFTFILPHFGFGEIIHGKTSNAAWIFEQAGGNINIANAFYAWFCLPLFRFLLLRWIWHLGLWCYFLYRLNRLSLRLLPTHPDGTGGLGYLDVVHRYFTPLAFAFAALESSSLAEEISSGSMPFEELYYLIPLVLLLNLLFFIGPLFLFSGRLWRCKVNGLNEYMVMAHHYVEAFDQTWLRDKSVTGKSQLGTGDIQSLADLTNSINVIRGMSIIPSSRSLLIAFTLSVVVPFLPFVFMKLNFSELMLKLFERISG